jgi:large subunit ribosomal protein L19
MNTKAIAYTPVDMTERKKLGIRAGDTVKVWQKIQEKGKTRLQVFEGLILAVKHGGEPGATFTVRRVASGVGVEKIFPLYSPMIDKISITKSAKVRRAKLYHIRDKAAKEIKRQMRNTRLISVKDEVAKEPDLVSDEEEKVETSEVVEKTEE